MEMLHSKLQIWLVIFGKISKKLKIICSKIIFMHIMKIEFIWIFILICGRRMCLSHLQVEWMFSCLMTRHCIILANTVFVQSLLSILYIMQLGRRQKWCRYSQTHALPHGFLKAGWSTFHLTHYRISKRVRAFICVAYGRWDERVAAAAVASQWLKYDEMTQ